MHFTNYFPRTLPQLWELTDLVRKGNESGFQVESMKHGTLEQPSWRWWKIESISIDIMEQRPWSWRSWPGSNNRRGKRYTHSTSVAEIDFMQGGCGSSFECGNIRLACNLLVNWHTVQKALMTCKAYMQVHQILHKSNRSILVQIKWVKSTTRDTPEGWMDKSDKFAFRPKNSCVYTKHNLFAIYTSNIS